MLSDCLPLSVLRKLLSAKEPRQALFLSARRREQVHSASCTISSSRRQTNLG